MIPATESCASSVDLALLGAGAVETSRRLAILDHAQVCARCRDALIELGAARTALLGSDETDASRRAAANILARLAARRPPWWRRWVVLAPVAAAAVVLLVVAPRPGGEGVRAKGALGLEMYCKRGDEVFPAADGADYRRGDRLRFAYTAPSAGYLVVFGVDNRGAVFPYYPERTLAGMPVSAGARVFLPASIELDEHRGWERIFALYAPTPFDDGAVRAAVRQALGEAGGDIRRAVRLPGAPDQISYLLRRP